MSAIIGLTPCSETSWASQHLVLVQLAPWFVAFGLFGASLHRTASGRWRKHFLLISYGVYLHFCQCAIWIVSAALAVRRTWPECPEDASLLFPSSALFALSSVGTLILSYSWFWGCPLTWLYWALTWIFLLLYPALSLVYWRYYQWHEALISCALGVASTLLFTTVLYVYLAPMAEQLVKSAPWCWFGCSHDLVARKGTVARRGHLHSRNAGNGRGATTG